MWRIVTPFLLVLILAATWAGYKPMTYDNYEFPTWANLLGWVVSFVSVLAIPTVMVLKIMKTPGTLGQRISILSRPTANWGPRLEENRIMAERSWDDHGYTCSNMKLPTYGNMS